MNSKLTRPVTEKEVKEALFSMHPNKAPGPDADANEAAEIMKIISVYGRASGQEINMEKSSMFVSNNATIDTREEMLRLLGQIKLVQYSKYLGLPLGIGRSRAATLRFLKENLTKKLMGWKGKLLSEAGKEVLLKSVALALPSYAMSVFKLPVGLCKEINRMVAKFWWGNDEKENKIHWKKWEDISEVKGKGGLGFRDIQCFNIALLAKQVWRMFTNPNLLVIKVIKGKYFPQSSIFEAKSKYGSSWIWQSLQSSIEMLESGLRSQVGDGKTINIWKDKWLKGNKKDKVTLMRPPNCKLEKVSELMNGQMWNERKISAIFSIEDACKIKSIPLSLYRKNDRKIWTATKNGRYTTKTGYDRAKELMKEDKGQNQQEAGSSRNTRDPRIWHQVWDLNVKHKVKLFLWKCLHNVLPTSENIFRRVRKGDHWCKRCGADVETVEHLFFHCKENYMIWETFPIQWEGLHQQTGSFWEWWAQLQQARNRAGGKEHIEATVNLLWQVWKSRNNWCFNSNKVEGHKVSQRAMTEWLEYKDATKHQLEEMQINRSSRTRNFMLTTELHSQHAIVIYTDAAHNRIKGKFGIGIAAKDGNGKLMCTWAIPCVAMENAAILEALAIRTCLLKAVEENWTDLLIVSDCKELVTSLSQENEDLSDFDAIVNDIKTLSRSFWRCSFSFSKREGNSCCHGLAQLATNLICESKWKTSFPVWVSKSAQADYLAVASSFV